METYLQQLKTTQNKLESMLGQLMDMRRGVIEEIVIRPGEFSEILLVVIRNEITKIGKDIELEISLNDPLATKDEQ